MHAETKFGFGSTQHGTRSGRDTPSRGRQAKLECRARTELTLVLALVGPFLDEEQDADIRRGLAAFRAEFCRCREQVSTGNV